MLDIKLKEMKRRAPCKHIFCPQTYPRPLGSGKNLSECGHIAYQIKGKVVKTNTETIFLTLHTPLTSG